MKDIFEDMNLLFDFLREYARQSAAGTMFGDTPLLKRYENEVRQARQKNWQINGQDSEESSVLNRARLIYFTMDFLFLVHSHSNNSNLTKMIRNLAIFFPKLDGFWVESEIGATNFWQFEKISNCYFLYYYKKTKNANGEYGLRMTRYEFYLYREVSGQEMAYVGHPSLMKEMVKENANPAIMNKYKNWSYVSFSSAKTKLCAATNDYDQPTLIEFVPTNINNWFKLQKLYRVEDSKSYKEMLDLPIEDEYHQDRYTFRISLWAITREYLYLILFDDDKKFFGFNADDKTTYFMKVPKLINSALDDIRINDVVGLVSFEDQSYYIGVACSNLFIEVTTQEQRQELGIEFTTYIDE